ncbi:MAG: SPOR domain-containing protein [Gammaproteobacteria bacterium]|nr:SPOR domain-containing protein [Gammaproteobacteria bacterium]
MPAKKKRSKRKTGATRNTEQNSSGLTWIVMGLLGLFVAFLWYLDKIPNQEGQQNTASQQGANKQSTAKNTKKSLPPKHQFDFYTVLPDRKVEAIDLDEERTSRKAVTPNQTKQVSNSQLTKNQQVTGTNKVKEKVSAAQSMSLYQLQVGAFRELSKADAMKAQIAFLGVESNIQVIHIKGQKMYRVRVGPSTDSQKINRIKEQLKAQNINTFVQKLKG